MCKMSIYKTRIYDIVHSGYSLLMDSRPNHQGSLIDGKLIKTLPVVENGELLGYKPSSRSKTVRFPTFLIHRKTF